MNTELQKKFPEGFLWGAATASFQVEGGIENVDWAEAARNKRVPSAGKACEQYTRYEQDFDIAKSLGHNAHRLSIEWARIEPEEGKFDGREINHYREVLQALRARGLKPFVTLWHFTQPQWFVDRGGFEAADASDIFARYCAYTAGRLSDLADYFITINEPYVWAGNGYQRGKWPPFVKSFRRFWKVISALAQSHIQAYRAIKLAAPHVHVGVAKNNIYFHSADFWGDMKAHVVNWFWNERLLNQTHRYRTLDFIGFNYYMHSDFSRARKPDDIARDRHGLPKGTYTIVPEKNDLGWDIYPEGLYHLLIALKKYNRPIYITENGLADAEDTKRERFIRSHLEFAHRAIEDGVDLRGYFHWSLIDNYEWAEGYSARFGLVEINYDTMERIVRPSARAYEQIARNNAL